MLNERMVRTHLLTLLHYVLCRNVLKNSPKKQFSKFSILWRKIATNKACVTLWPKLPFTLKKSILRQKKKKKKHGNSNISPCRNIIFKKSSKRNQNPSRYYYNSIITNLKFQHKPKISPFKNAHVKIDLLLLPRGQNPFKLLYSIMNLNTIYPCLG